MAPEFDYLIHLVRCAIHDLQPKELPPGMDFNVLYECDAFHHVANIAFDSLNKLEKSRKDRSTPSGCCTMTRQWFAV